MLIGKVDTYDAQDPPQYLNLRYQDGKLPGPHVEIESSEFLAAMSCALPNAVGFETITLPDAPGAWETHYWFFKDKVIALATLYCHPSPSFWEIDSGTYIGDGSASGFGTWFRFFLCGCQHTRMIWTGAGGMFGHETKGVCPDCGYEIEEDSSGN